MANPSWTVHRRGPLTARWISRASGTPAVAVETEAAVVAGPRLPVVAQHRQQARQLVERVQHRQARRLVEQVPRRLRVELRKLVDRQRLAAAEHRRLGPALVVAAGAVVAAAVAAGMRPALQTRMAPSTLHSSRWPAMPTVCRR